MNVNWMLCGRLWSNVDVMWNIVNVNWMLCGRLWRNVDVLWSNVGVMWTLHISTFHNLTKSSPLPSLVSHLEISDCGCNVDLPHLHIYS